MGIYYTTIVFYGFLTKNSTTSISTDSKIITNKGTFVFVPKTKKSVGFLDPCIDKDDMKQGYVAMADLLKFKLITEDHFKLEKEDKELIKKHAETCLEKS